VHLDHLVFIVGAHVPELPEPGRGRVERRVAVGVSQQTLDGLEDALHAESSRPFFLAERMSVSKSVSESVSGSVSESVSESEAFRGPLHQISAQQRTLRMSRQMLPCMSTLGW